MLFIFNVILPPLSCWTLTTWDHELGFLKIAPAPLVENAVYGKEKRAGGGDGSDDGIWESLKLVRGQGTA